ncbi:hypothetical protein ULG90_12660 [Halopseudomonas pachastrellae]|nr:hypothetical protein ULG90_12660 [Halopseudomonas pachastrellae]
MSLLLTADLINLQVFAPFEAFTQASFNLVSVITTTVLPRPTTPSGGPSVSRCFLSSCLLVVALALPVAA